jgi:hypothetical protein
MEDIGKSFPVVEGIVDAEQGDKKKPSNEYCLNCGTILLDIYCHHCGQKDLPKRQTMGELIENFIGSFFSFESKFFRSVKFLLLKPGFLPVEYTSGKRESYYHPARAYVFISFVFFLLLFWLPDSNESKTRPLTADENIKLNENLQKVNEELNKAGIDSLGLDTLIQEAKANNNNNAVRSKSNEVRFSLSETPFKTLKEYDSVQRTLPESERDNWFMRKLNYKNIELNEKYKGDDGGARLAKEMGTAFLENFSKVLFFLLPIFALLLKLLYVRRDYYYSEHLVFSIFYYNFFYLAASVYMIADLIPYVGGLLAAIISIWIFIYLPIAMKKMYNQSWGKTIGKFVLLSLSFLVCLLLGIAGNLLFIVMNL